MNTGMATGGGAIGGAGSSGFVGGGGAGACAGAGGEGCAEVCCDGTGAVTSASWQYVGPGKGGYSQVTNYNYNGMGQGDWERVSSVQYSGWRLKPCCLGVLMLGLLLPLLYLVFNLFSDKTDKSEGPDLQILYTTKAPPGPNCLDKSAWTPSKQTYCCQHFKIGCPQPQPPAPPPPRPPPPRPQPPVPPTPPQPQPPVTTSRPFDCSADWTTCYSCLQHRWSPAKRDYCCATARRGCPQPAPPVQPPPPMPQPAPPAPPAPPAAPVSEPYDCNAGYTHCHHCLADKWSVSKIDWCCAHKGMGCGAAR